LFCFTDDNPHPHRADWMDAPRQRMWKQYKIISRRLWGRLTIIVIWAWLGVEATTDDGSHEHSCLAVSETEVSFFVLFVSFFCKEETGVS
jgi:hypothetical protein